MKQSEDTKALHLKKAKKVLKIVDGLSHSETSKVLKIVMVSLGITDESISQR